MRAAIAKLAKAAVTALVKSDPSALAIAGAHEAIDRLLAWLPHSEKSKLEQLQAQVGRELEQFAAAEYRGRAGLDAALGNATTLFESYGLSAGELVDRGLVPLRASEELLARGHAELRSAGEDVAGLCTRIVRRTYDLLLNDHATIAGLQPSTMRALLAQRELIKDMPHEVGRALRRMFGRNLVIDPREVWRPGLPEVYLLRAEYGVVPFHPERRPEVERLLAWCEAEAPLAVQVMTGAGGTGKTRLMIEVCRKMRLRRWRAGFLHRETPTVPSWELDGLVEGEQPLLLVVDYAETKRDVLVPVLRRIAAEPPGKRIRVVLLARESRTTDWWPALQRADPKLQEMLDDKVVATEPLAPIADPVEQRPQVLQAAAAAFADTMRCLHPETAGMELAAPHFANALFLHIKALAAVVGDPATEEDALLRFVLTREERHWEEGLKSAHLAQDLDVACVRQAVALVTMADGAADRPDARRLLERAPKLTGLTPPKRDRLADLVHRLYPGERWLESMRPDLLGEHLAGEALADEPTLLDGALQSNPEHTLTVLTHLARRRPDAVRWLEQAFAHDLEGLAEPAIKVAIEAGDPIGPVLARALEGQILEDPWRLEPLVPWETTALREVGAVVLLQMRWLLQKLPQPWPEAVRAEVARMGNRLAYRLRALGRREEALQTAQEAVAIHRELAAARPDAFRPNLALSLTNLAAMLSELGRREAALQAAQEAAGLYRELAAARPDAFHPNLAVSLNNLAIMLSELGRREAALQAAQEAVELSQELAAARPDTFRPDLALSLTTLAARLGELGRREDALQAAQEAAELYRELAAARPDAFRPDLALSLTNLANSLSELGRREAALQAAQEAVELYRELAVVRPDAFRPDLAASLAVLANCLESLDSNEEALDADREAIAMLAPAFLQHPWAFAHWMLPMCQRYLERCEKLGSEPDIELLAPIAEALEQVQLDPFEPDGSDDQADQA